MSSFNQIKNTVAIFSVPRSGTSWVGQIFNSSPRVVYRYQPLFSYEFKDRLNEGSSKEDIAQFYKDLLDASSDFVLQKETINGNKGASFAKKNTDTLVWKEVRYINIIENLLQKTDTKVVLLIRHPCAVINSWLRAPKEFDSAWGSLEEWQYAKKKNQGKKENYFGYEKWKEAAELFISLRDKYPDKVMVVKYEELVQDSVATTKKMFNFASIPFEKQTKDFIVKSTSSNDNDPYGVFRRLPDPEKWKNELDDKVKNKLLKDFDRSSLKEELGY